MYDTNAAETDIRNVKHQQMVKGVRIFALVKNRETFGNPLDALVRHHLDASSIKQFHTLIQIRLAAVSLLT